MKVEIIPIEKIRKPESWGAKSKTGKSIRSLGFVSALTVREVDGEYEIIDGRRRYSDLVDMEAHNVPCVIVEANDAQAAAMALALNTARSDSPMDEAEQIMHLDEAGFDEDYVSRMIGVSKATIKKRLRMAALPEKLKQGFRSGKIAIGTTTSLANMDTDQQEKAVGLFKRYGEVKSTDVTAIKNDIVERGEPTIETTPIEIFKRAVEEAFGAGLTENQMVTIIKNYTDV